MAVINYFKKEIHIKIVYCGPGLSGKTSNLQWLNQNLKDGKVGKLISLATKTDRTLFFDLLAVSKGKIRGFDTRIQLFTTPGQVFYNATRKLVLKSVDGLVFVADSQEPMRSANRESLENLEQNLLEYGMHLEDLPLIFQYNKRDLPNLLSIEDLEADLNPRGLPYFEGSALTGQGVRETYETIVERTIKSLKELHEAPEAAAPTPAPAVQVSVTPSPKVSAPPLPPRTKEAAGTPAQIRSFEAPQLQADGSLLLPIRIQSAAGEQTITLEIRLRS